MRPAPITGALGRHGVRVLGTQVEAIEATGAWSGPLPIGALPTFVRLPPTHQPLLVEDRGIFSDKLNEINERIAPSYACDTLDEALVASEKIGFPCMVRCAFALGGLGSALIDDRSKFEDHCREAFASSPQARRPIQLSLRPTFSEPQN